jgi:hypothetical protein
MQAYDPLNYDNLARNVVGAMLDRPTEPLPLQTAYDGCGVYAIYYNGDFPAYAEISKSRNAVPIYVGKAVPQGARKGGAGLLNTDRRALYNRLAQHSKSIEQAQNLEISDFTCRYLVVVPVWIALAERFLIEHFRPLWNVVLDGFGNHDPGKGRTAMKRPRWDILHPGRPWAKKLTAAETEKDLLLSVGKAISIMADHDPI